MPRRPALAVLTALSVLAVALPAQAAASLSGGAFGTGLTAPVVLTVHLLGLLALGLWAADQGGQASGQGPAVALVAALVFGLLHQSGVRLPYGGLVLEASLLVFGLLTAFAVALPLALTLLLAAVAGAAHGMGLSAWVGAPSSPLPFWLGTGCGFVLVGSAGVGLHGLLAQNLSATAVRAAGGMIALAGLLMLLDVM
ncbi:HupE/UreJ family protein [Rhodospirillum centenum]|uniref:Urease accessory protein UreJ n=1 Tax=Rhodospirillum centenum (strain ATCC 51521 / SW) TaxID=414684 RepID=B6IPL2_RHOCS|nr:HupE/UreJ family protein [Rhodospirillum centenum]ACI99714.1 hypothetical protein RC1_2327 [Rhodospirillum centenum SW]